jgi:hypothetical protein
MLIERVLLVSGQDAQDMVGDVVLDHQPAFRFGLALVIMLLLHPMAGMPTRVRSAWPTNMPTMRSSVLTSIFPHLRFHRHHPVRNDQ